MTPPDSVLSLLGALSVGALLWLLWQMRPRRARPTPPPSGDPALTDERTGRRLAYERDVLRPGLLHVAFNRDSISMGDDSEDHWAVLMFEELLPLSAVLGPPIFKVLPSIPGGQDHWLIDLREELTPFTPATGGAAARPGRMRVTPLAVVQRGQPAAHLLTPDVPVSRLMGATLFARPLARRAGEEVVAGTPDAAPHEAELWTTLTYDIDRVPAGPRVMIRVARPEAGPVRH